MASSICQVLPNCLEPCFPKMTHNLCDSNSGLETSHVHEKTQKLGSNKAQENSNDEKGGWSFIQALSNTIEDNNNDNDNEKVYIHPLSKRFSSALSEKSLEMCTESLGSETGSDGNQSSDEVPFLSSENHPKERSKLRLSKICNRDTSFPPPLKYAGSSRGVQVKSYREGGRLILEASMVTPTISFFHAERSEGRLRLCFLDDCSLGSIYRGDQVQEGGGEYDHDDIEFEEEYGDEEYRDSVVNFDEDIEGSSGNADGETAIGKFPSPSRCRCKEGGHGNKGLQNWEPFWVAT